MNGAADDPKLHSWSVRFAPRKTLPCVFIDHQPVGGFGEIRALVRSDRLGYLVRGPL